MLQVAGATECTKTTRTSSHLRVSPSASPFEYSSTWYHKGITQVLLCVVYRIDFRVLHPLLIDVLFPDKDNAIITC